MSAEISCWVRSRSFQGTSGALTSTGCSSTSAERRKLIRTAREHIDLAAILGRHELAFELREQRSRATGGDNADQEGDPGMAHHRAERRGVGRLNRQAETR